jgi:hypothetical protein
MVVMVTKGTGLCEVRDLVQTNFDPTDPCIVGHAHPAVVVVLCHGNHTCTISSMTIRGNGVVGGGGGVIVVVY